MKLIILFIASTAPSTIHAVQHPERNPRSPESIYDTPVILSAPTGYPAPTSSSLIPIPIPFSSSYKPEPGHEMETETAACVTPTTTSTSTTTLTLTRTIPVVPVIPSSVLLLSSSIETGSVSVSVSVESMVSSAAEPLGTDVSTPAISYESTSAIASSGVIDSGESSIPQSSSSSNGKEEQESATGKPVEGETTATMMITTATMEVGGSETASVGVTQSSTSVFVDGAGGLREPGVVGLLAGVMGWVVVVL